MMQPLLWTGSRSPFLRDSARPFLRASSKMKQYRPGPPVRCQFPCAPGASWAFLRYREEAASGDKRGRIHSRPAAALSNKFSEVIQ